MNGESFLYAGETFSFSLGAHIDDVGAAVKLALHSNPAACSCSGYAVGACACPKFQPSVQHNLFHFHSSGLDTALSPTC